MLQRLLRQLLLLQRLLNHLDVALPRRLSGQLNLTRLCCQLHICLLPRRGELELALHRLPGDLQLALTKLPRKLDRALTRLPGDLNTWLARRQLNLSLARRLADQLELTLKLYLTLQAGLGLELHSRSLMNLNGRLNGLCIGRHDSPQYARGPDLLALDAGAAYHR